MVKSVIRVVVVLMSCLLTGCVRFDNTCTYNKLSAGQQVRVKVADRAIDLLTATDTVYRVNANDIRTLAQKHKDILVHEFTYYCKSDRCANPWTVKKFCEERGITYCIISTTFDEIFMLNTPTPKLVVDEVYYNTKWEGVNLNRFEEDLTGKTSKEMNYPLYFYFHDGKFVKGYKWYEDVKKL